MECFEILNTIRRFEYWFVCNCAQATPRYERDRWTVTDAENFRVGSFIDAGGIRLLRSRIFLALQRIFLKNVTRGSNPKVAEENQILEGATGARMYGNHVLW